MLLQHIVTIDNASVVVSSLTVAFKLHMLMWFPLLADTDSNKQQRQQGDTNWNRDKKSCPDRAIIAS